MDLPAIETRFDLSGSAAGMYCYKSACRWLRFNPWVFATDMALHLSDTVPHEVAHYAVHQCFGSRGVKPHGAEWRALMLALGANPSATYRADLSGVPTGASAATPTNVAAGCTAFPAHATTGS